jgi:thiol-disulfide isomerase/thioredoxin
MQGKNWIIGLVFIVIVVAVLGYWGFKKGPDTSTNPNAEVSGEQTENPVYFDDSAKVMYFYQDTCGWCIKQKEVLAKLGQEGYRVKSMNITKDQSLWEKYKISGTPTFIAEGGETKVGYLEYNDLKAFLDKYK